MKNIQQKSSKFQNLQTPTVKRITKITKSFRSAKRGERAKRLGCKIVIGFSRADIGRIHGCGELLTFETSTADHIIQLSKGGAHCPCNVKLACEKCNHARNKN